MSDHPTDAERRDVEAWASAKKTPQLWFKAAAVMHHWPLGEQLTEAEYDQAIKNAMHGAPTR